jgi:hypothetical protein
VASNFPSRKINGAASYVGKRRIRVLGELESEHNLAQDLFKGARDDVLMQAGSGRDMPIASRRMTNARRTKRGGNELDAILFSSDSRSSTPTREYDDAVTRVG